MLKKFFISINEWFDDLNSVYKCVILYIFGALCIVWGFYIGMFLMFVSFFRGVYLVLAKWNYSDE